MNARCLLALAALLASSQVHAFGAGARIGSTGVGVDVGWELSSSWDLRVGYAGGTYRADFNSSDVAYTSKTTLSNANAFLDWAVAGPFRLTGGVIGTASKLEVNGQPTGGTFTINGNIYPAAAVGNLSGTVKPGNQVAPYFGIGWGRVARPGVNFYFDLGVAYIGSFKSTLTAMCGSGLTPAQCAQLQGDVAAEQQQLSDSLKRYKYYPVGSLGVTIGF